jgi:hypothetical protein
MTTNLYAYGAMLRIADEYERLADMADRERPLLSSQSEGFQLFRILIASLVRAVRYETIPLEPKNSGCVLGNRLRFI